MNIPDLLLFTRAFFKRINDRKLLLIAGMFLVGLIDITFPFVLDNFSLLFLAKAGTAIIYNIMILIAVSFALGLIDTVFFALPLFDLFRIFKKDGDHGPHSLTKLMKIYIVAHIPLLPANALIYLAAANAGASPAPDSLNIYIIAYVGLAAIIWFSAIIARGVNTIYSFAPLFRRLVFIVAFIWNFLLGSGLEYLISNWVWKVFR